MLFLSGLLETCDQYPSSMASDYIVLERFVELEPAMPDHLTGEIQLHL